MPMMGQNDFRQTEANQMGVDNMNARTERTLGSGRPEHGRPLRLAERGAMILGASVGGAAVASIFVGLTLGLGALFSACSLQLRPLPKAETTEAVSGKPTKDPRVVFRFFDDDFTPGGYQYTYPDASKIYIPEESGHESDVALEFNLEASEYSGGSVCLYNLLYDMTPYYSKGALQFWIKGSRGGEIAWAALVDDENRDSKKTVVRLPLANYGGVTNEWRLVSIPLADFGKRGVFWDAKKRVEVPSVFDWGLVSEFRIEIKKAENPDFKVWVDDIFVLRDVFEPKSDAPTDYWDDKKEIVPPPPALPSDMQAKTVRSLFEDDLPAGGFTYVYGGKTAIKVQEAGEGGVSVAGKSNAAVLVNYLDNDDYSGTTLALGNGNNVDLSGLRQGTAGLAFWGKGSPGTRSIYIGFLDDESDGKKVQTKLAVSDFGQIDTTWRYYQIPIKRFLPNGRYWDADKKAEITDDVKWNAIQEIRFSNNKGENRPEPGQPVAFYIDDMRIIESIPGYIDPEAHWANFASTEAELLLHDLEKEADQKWDLGNGPKSEVAFAIVKPKGDAADKGKNSLQITYKLGDWCDVMYDYVAQKTDDRRRDWTKHWGLKVQLYTDKPFQGVTVQISDAGDELFVANIAAVKGWNDILIPFKNFSKFPYYQPPTAVQNGTFDLKGIRKIDFKPAGEGSRGVFLVDNVYLTNKRELPKPVVAAKRDIKVEVQGSKTVTKRINDGIFGINAALWDGDLLDGKTAKYVKAVNHKILRYPGGLRADDDDWEEVLAKKDFLVDIDEFLEFCKETGTEPMITVNFGTGTPEKAAKWVKHVNIDKKAKVKYWEVGNELYGDWHPNYTTGDDYGKRTVAFIKAMKAVDPTIEVAVVWVLEGDWNRQVFEHTKDLADAVIVHHYPQHSGEENDAALLAAPQSLNEILPSVRKQIKEHGKSGKHYGIWLTEWNSVDFKPGPQTLSLVNGLFVADYLGMLAVHNIEHADYWDIHNDITDQGGDYGYLSRNGAPDGDNVPRPSYHAFKLASDALRGELVACQTNDDNVTCYATKRPDGSKAMMFVNKNPETDITAKLDLAGFDLGNGEQAKVSVFHQPNAKPGPTVEKKSVKNGESLLLPRYSIVVVESK